MLNDNQENDFKLHSGKADKLFKQVDSFDIPNNSFVGTSYEDIMIAMRYGDSSILKSVTCLAEKQKTAFDNLCNSNINDNSIDENIRLSCMVENYVIADEELSYYKHTRTRLRRWKIKLLSFFIFISKVYIRLLYDLITR